MVPVSKNVIKNNTWGLDKLTFDFDIMALSLVFKVDWNLTISKRDVVYNTIIL